ncbi:SDR family NAD(P)-dependent oxidoreductase [Planococcus beijingensis]|uniref:SDR family NAD(P)-dependent oxidoreductase n=1 Tax=Planococcus beijingensis TaxID=2782551 RepID=UPI00193BC4EF|nr:3-oxoacyl-ACP reductase family protein [Planococcus beijingensis]
MDLFSLKGKTAIVTGGNRGLGKAIVMGLAKAGANVVVVSRDMERNKAVIDEVESLGGTGSSFSVDLRNKDSIAAMVDQVVERHGSIDILVNNAGVSSTNFALDVTEEDWDRVMDLNVKSLFFCCQAVASKMKEQNFGRIINMSSVVGQVGDVGISPYTASKAAVINLTRSLALEWSRFGINVNAVGPAYIETEMNRDELNTPHVRDKIINKTPLKRLGEPEELTGMIIALASNAGNFITGQTIFVDGGWLAQ